ncbi:hypothetical protein DFS33DRAFT_542591 [Desarmillaria ectypa]|nr:hypothetical protein DFS33DRAFT_542591 [Desarmillaria ectypa]
MMLTCASCSFVSFVVVCFTGCQLNRLEYVTGHLELSDSMIPLPIFPALYCIRASVILRASHGDNQLPLVFSKGFTYILSFPCGFLTVRSPIGYSVIVLS